MAVSLESAGKVRQKTKEFSKSPLVFYALKAFFHHHAQNNGNADLQFMPFTEVEADVAGGTVLLTGAAKVYFVYVKKENEGTDNTVFLYDDATDDTTAGDAKIGLDLALANEEALAIYPEGLDFATGIVVTQYSDGIGGTDGSNGGNGFLIIGS